MARTLCCTRRVTNFVLTINKVEISCVSYESRSPCMYNNGQLSSGISKIVNSPGYIIRNSFLTVYYSVSNNCKVYQPEPNNGIIVQTINYEEIINRPSRFERKYPKNSQPVTFYMFHQLKYLINYTIRYNNKKTCWSYIIFFILNKKMHICYSNYLLIPVLLIHFTYCSFDL